jgi:REP element-mobilizing transposase RayT
MARGPRVVIEGGLYHVYNRVSSGEHIFADPEEATEFIEIVRDVKKRDGWTVFAWCVMSNHIHLVVRTSSVPLWRGMHGIQNRFSRGFNRRFGRTGGLWQGRYKAKYFEDQSYLDRLVLYVHLNPVKGGLVEDPAEYPFGGHREVKRKIRNPLVDIDEMLLCFGETKKVARRNYLRAIRLGIDPDAPEIESSWHPFDRIKDEPLSTSIFWGGAPISNGRLWRPKSSFVGFVNSRSSILRFWRRRHGIATRPENDESSPLSVWKDGVRKERSSLRF